MGHHDFLCLDDRTLLGQCRVDTRRGTGPGGQKRNKTETMVRLHHNPTGLTTQSDATRSQATNKALALEKLREAIALQCRSPLTEPLTLSQHLTAFLGLTSEKVGKKNPKIFCAMAECLDVLAAHNYSLRDSAHQLGLSTAALAKIITRHPHLMAHVNGQRVTLGHPPLRI